MKNSQKGFVVPLLIAIIAVLAIGGGVYVYENKKAEVPVTVDSTIQQSNQSGSDHPTGAIVKNDINKFTGSANDKLNIVKLDINDPSVAKIDKNSSAYILTQGDTEGRSISVKINNSSVSTAPLQYGKPFTVSWNTTGVDNCSFGGPTGITYEPNSGTRTVGSRTIPVDTLPTSGTITVYAKNFEDYMSPFSFEINCSSKTNKYLAATLLIPVVVPNVSSFAFVYPQNNSQIYAGCGTTIKWNFPYPISSVDFQLFSAQNNKPVDQDQSQLYGLIARNVPSQYSWNTRPGLAEGKYYIIANVNKIPVSFKSDTFQVLHIPSNIKGNDAYQQFCSNQNPNVGSQTNPTIPQNIPIQNTANQTVSVHISFSSMNENVYSLLNNVTILGLKYLYPRNSGDATVVNAIDPTIMSMGDSCGETVQATLEIANPKIEGTHPTLHNDPTVAVDVVRVISHDNPQRSCAY